MPEINVVVHPSNEAPGFWRWAVHVGTDWTDPNSCLMAHIGDDRGDAAVLGQRTAVAVAKFAAAHGLLDGGDTFYLDVDPIGEPWPLTAVVEI
jgi:hypothetical protein